MENTKLLTTCIDNFFSEKKNLSRNGAGQHSFFVLSGPKSIGKSTIIQEIINERVGQFAYHDVLYIRDLSSIIGKKHSLKIDTPKKKEKQFIPLDPDGKEKYEDIGIRQINHRLQQSPMGRNKVVIIENIERIVTEAANAFLKTLEEPLPNRLIIATVSHSSQMLETIFSRALVLRFQEL
ncbi:AAA family ATPase [Patescibacteria group bacterium]|nr:AAA family ATPase [Patescibacteria group bacterium]MBU1758657.1 AAA family ATPase [Patescibacteria group bacterium]